MIEAALFILTLGALLFHTGQLSLFSVCIVSLFFGAGFFLWVPSRRGCVAAALIVIVCFMGALAVWSREETVPPAVFGSRTFEARVVSTNRTLDRTVIVVQDTHYAVRIQVTLYAPLDVLPGDTIRIKGLVERPEDFLTDNGRLFEYSDYLHSKGIVAVARGGEVTLLQTGGFGLARAATRIRYACADIVTRFVSFPNDGIVSGMLLGYQGGVPQDVDDLFRATGVLHVLVLSGYNIMLLAGFLGLVLQQVPHRARILLTFFAIVLLVLISGTGVASVRAGVMGSIALMATLALESYNPLRALAVSYIIFFFWSPTAIFSDPGFHLSFLATLCMITVIPKVERVFSRIPQTSPFNLREIVMLSLVMPLCMLPYLMYFSGEAPLAAVPANIVLAVATPVIMVLGIVVLGVSFIPSIAYMVGSLLSLVVTTVVQLLELLARLPHYNTPTLRWWGVVVVYGALFVLLFYKEGARFIARVRKMLLLRPSSYSQ